MPELVFISTTVDRGGAEILLLGMVKALRPEYKISVIYIKGRGSLKPDLQALGAEVKKLGLRSILRVLNILRKNGEAILQGWMYHGNILASILHVLALGRGKLFWAVHHSADAYSRESLAKKMLLRSTALISRMPAGIVYVSEPVKVEHENFGYKNRNTRVIHNGIDTNQFKMDDIARHKIRDELGIPFCAPVLGAVGRNHPVKNYKTFFRAVAILLHKHPQLHVVVVGRDLDLSEFTLQLQDLESGELCRIHLLGERTDVPQVLSIMDVFALCSLSESFSLSLIEALATGRCCVSTDVVFFQDLFPEALSTFKSHNYKALVEGVERYLSLSSEHRRSIGNKARIVVEDHFTLFGMLQFYREFWGHEDSWIDMRSCHLSERAALISERLGIRPFKAEDAAIPRMEKSAGHAVIHAGGEFVGKRWPPERYTQIIGHILETGICGKVYLIGDCSDLQINARIIEMVGDPRVLDQAGKLSLEENQRLIATAKLFIGNDSGPMHIATLSGVPTIGLMGPNLPRIIGPLGDNSRYLYHQFPCSGCDQRGCKHDYRCIKAITVPEVIAVIEELVSNGKD